jgi:hypothetical protein
LRWKKTLGASRPTPARLRTTWWCSSSACTSRGRPPPPPPLALLPLLLFPPFLFSLLLSSSPFSVNQGFKSPAIATAIARYNCLRKIKLFVSMYNLAAIARYIPI